MGRCQYFTNTLSKIKNRRSWFTDRYQVVLKCGRIRCSDTDMLIMLLYYSAVMITEVELWFWRREKQYFSIHKLSLFLGIEDLKLHPLIHAFSGKDATIILFSVWKTTMLKARKKIDCLPLKMGEIIGEMICWSP